MSATCASLYMCGRETQEGPQDVPTSVGRLLNPEADEPCDPLNQRATGFLVSHV